MTWLEQILSTRSELEAPLNFWYWSALSCISAVVKDNIWIDRAAIYNLYPNIYVMFHAESGLKKGAPVAMARRLVSTVNNTKVISGRSSIQGILKDMGSTSQARTQPGGKIDKPSSSVFICSSELTSSIVEDKVATTILTDLFDRNWNQGEWRSLLKMESFTLHNPTVTMLTATNDAHSSDFFAKKDIQGGYFARTFIVYEKEENRINSLLLPLKNPPNDKATIEYLKTLGQLKGAFRPLAQYEQTDEYHYKWIDPESGSVGYFTDAGRIYQEWYYDFKLSLKNQFIKDETGTLNRFGDSVLKVAILLSLAKEAKLELDSEAMKEAIIVCEKLIGNMRQTTLGARGMSDASPLKAKIMMELQGRENYSISRTMLMNKLWMHYTEAHELDELMNSLDAAGVLHIESIGNNMVYRLTDKHVNDMGHFLKGKIVKEK